MSDHNHHVHAWNDTIDRDFRAAEDNLKANLNKLLYQGRFPPYRDFTMTNIEGDKVDAKTVDAERKAEAERERIESALDEWEGVLEQFDAGEVISFRYEDQTIAAVAYLTNGVKLWSTTTSGWAQQVTDERFKYKLIDSFLLPEDIDYHAV